MRKHYILVAVTLLAFAACKNNMDVTPDPGAQLAGSYEINNIRFDSASVSIYNYILPTDTFTGTMTVRRDSARLVYVTYALKEAVYGERSGEFGQLKLKGTAAPYDLYYGNEKVGSADGKAFIIDYSYIDQGSTYRQIFSSQRK